MKKIISWVVIAVFLANYIPVYPLYAATRKTSIAVYPLSVRGLSEDRVASLTAILRDAANENESLALLSEVEMKRILTAKTVKQDCDTDPCFSEVARALGVELLVSGTISKMGSIYVVSLQLIGSDKEYALDEVTLNCQAEKEALNRKIKEAGRMLLKEIKPKLQEEIPSVAGVPETAMAEKPAAATGKTEPPSAAMEVEAAKPAPPARVSKVIISSPQPVGRKAVKVITLSPPPKTPEAAVTSGEKVKVKQERPKTKPQAEPEVNKVDKVAPAPPQVQVVEEKPAVPPEEDESEEISAEKSVVKMPQEKKAKTPQELGKPGERKRTIGWTALGIGAAAGLFGISQVSAYNANVAKINSFYDDDDDDAGDKLNASNQGIGGAARIGFGVAAIGVAVATYCWQTVSDEPLPSTSAAVPQVIIKPQNINLSWWF